MRNLMNVDVTYRIDCGLDTYYCVLLIVSAIRPHL